MAILSDQELVAYAKIPQEWVDRVNGLHDFGTESWTQTQVAYQYSWITAQLATKHDTNFSDPYPTLIKGWVATLVASDVILALGHDPNATDSALYEKRAQQVRDDIARSLTPDGPSLSFPLKQDSAGNSRTKGRVRSSSYANPYLSARHHAQRAREEVNNDSPKRTR
jgi:hypothetical protein